MKITETFTSSTATHVKFDIYQPNVIIRYKGIIQIHHGLSEYSDRYKRFAEFLSHEGYIVVVTDFPGHGTSLQNFEQGYFGDGNAIDTLVEDMHRLKNIIQKRYEELAYFMIGVGFGSLVLRKYLTKYGDHISGAILIGTCMKHSVHTKAKMLVKIDKALHGQMNRSLLLKKAFDAFNHKHLEGNYKTSDEREWEDYDDDPMTEFVYTTQAYSDILDYIYYTSLEENIKKMPTYIPLYLLSGKKDNFSNQGKDIVELYNILTRNKHYDVTYKLYEDAKRDILHESNRQEVFKDILQWLSERTYV